MISEVKAKRLKRKKKEKKKKKKITRRKRKKERKKTEKDFHDHHGDREGCMPAVVGCYSGEIVDVERQAFEILQPGNLLHM